MSKSTNRQQEAKAIRLSLDLIGAELDFHRHIFSDSSGEVRAHLGLVLLPYMSSFLIESSNFLTNAGNKDLIGLNADGVDVLGRALNLLTSRQLLIERCRQRMKFLDDNKMTYNEIVAVYTQAIDIDRRYYEELHSGFAARVKRMIQPDLGLTLVNNRVLTTTHVSFTNVALDELHILIAGRKDDRESNFLYNLALDYGRYIGDLNQALRPERSWRVMEWPVSETNMHYVDIRSRSHYRDVSKRLDPDRSEIAPFLYIILSQLRTVAWLIAPLSNSVLPFFALRCLLLLTYQSFRSLSTLLDEIESGTQTVERFVGDLERVVNDPRVQRVLGFKFLRNSLMHFGINRHVSAQLPAHVDETAFLRAHGVVETTVALRTDLVDVAEWVGDQIESWLKSPIRLRKKF